MTTTSAPPDGGSTYTTALGNDVVFERVPNGGGTVRGLKIFRAGSFRDSAGRPHKWGADDLRKMVTHFSVLRDNGIFADVPVRKSHGRDVGQIVGYIDKVSTDGKFLYADLEITEPDAADKIERKTFRSRSLEVGPYVDNDEKVYSPAITGLAFVDIGAVEGLFNNDSNPSYFIITENDMSEAVTFQQTQVDWAVAAAYAKGLEDAPKPTITGDLAPFEFTYGGQKTADPKAVQSYINTLETAQAEQRDASRKAYVTALASAKKIPATQVDAAQAFVLTMSDSQFEAYKAINDVAPTMTKFEQHVDSGNGTGEEIEPDQDLRDAEQTVAMHRHAGMDEATLVTLPSYQKMLALKNATK